VRSFVLPGETPLPNAAISDTGKLVKYLVEHDDKYHKRTIAFNSQSISELDKLKVLEKGKGRHAVKETYGRLTAYLSSLQHPCALSANTPTRVPPESGSGDGTSHRARLHRAVDDFRLEMGDDL
jgi:hypothetical protein